MISKGTKATPAAHVHSNGGNTANNNNAETTAHVAAIHSIRLEGVIFIGPPFCHTPPNPQPSI